MKKYLLPIILSIFSFNAIFAQSGQTYTVTLDHNDNTGVKEKITVTYGEPMPEDIGLIAPTRIGYDFTGYSKNGTYYYDADLKSARKYIKTKNYTIFANWKAHTTTVYLDFQEGENGTAQVATTYDNAMPIGEEIVAPVRSGYTFAGYYTDINGNGVQYYNADMTSTRSWDIDVAEIQLYAYWIPNITYVTDITLSDFTANLLVDATKTLTATITPATASNTDVIWSSSNESIATVSSDGTITAIAEGSCTITCTAADGSGITSTCDVTVRQQAISIDFEYETLDMTAGTVKTITPVITPSNADIETLTWESSNTNVVNITEGILTAITPGTATIKCIANGEYEATMTVNVTSLNITEKKPAIAEGTYGEGGIIFTRSVTENQYATFCMPYDIDLSEYTDNFSKVYVPMGITLLNPNGTLMIMFKDVPFTETIPAGQPFIVYGAQSAPVSIMNSSEVTISSLAEPEPINLDVYNWNGSNGFMTLNSDISLKIGGTYTKLSGLEQEKYYVFATNGSIKNGTSLSPYRVYVYKNDELSNAKITDIQFSLNEDNTVTGIENIVDEQSNNDNVYNLNGQRINISNVQNGVYIFNGKKYMK